jgi:tetratricopeptide (TPR) repeat protein
MKLNNLLAFLNDCLFRFLKAIRYRTVECMDGLPSAPDASRSVVFLLEKVRFLHPSFMIFPFLFSCGEFIETVKTQKLAAYYFDKGRLYFYDNKPDSAIIWFTESIRYIPDASAYYNRGLVKHSLADFSNAAEDFSQAIRINPSDADSWINRASCKTELCDYQGALSDLDSAEKKNSSDSLIWYNRGIALVLIGRNREAAEEFSKVIKADPKDRRAFFQRGEAYFACREFILAASDYSHALMLYPKDEEAELKMKLVQQALSAE